ncbi:MAG: hypothetical protein ABSF49_05190 [Roseiarcus sp.]|jgi:hypothetical protein|uniref:hypothetical protein n=1 Tax=Roseiarcus sp. TaxID=1969460 RepID=UPI003C298E7D
MNVKRKLTLAVCALCGGALLAAGAGFAQTTPLPAADSAGAVTMPAGDATPAKPKPKPKPKKPAEATIAVEVTNSRAVGLTSLVGAISGTPDSKKIAGPLAAGKKTIAHLAHDKACLFDLHAVFEDGAVTDAQGVELCKDKKINLTE